MTPEELREKVADAMSSAAISFDPNAECVGAAISVCMEAAAGVPQVFKESANEKPGRQMSKENFRVTMDEMSKVFRSLIPEKKG